MHDALAYIDPGAASLAIQAAIAAALSIPYLLRRQLARWFRAVRSRRGVSEPPPGSSGKGKAADEG